MAISSYQCYLMYATSSSATKTKLCDIKGLPATGGAPENIDVTTLSDGVRKYIAGIIETQSLEFKANYDSTLYSTLKGLEGSTVYFAIYFGGTNAGVPDGHNGQLAFTGQLTAWTDAADVNSVVEIAMSIAVDSDFTFTVPSL